jgi:hypothetical protein
MSGQKFFEKKINDNVIYLRTEGGSMRFYL